MPARLLVILGAGASWDCASGSVPDIDLAFRPPLVTELFEGRPAFTKILHEYPLAEQAAADIRPAVSSGSIALEAFLKDDLRDSEHAYRRRQFWAIPLYLQHLLFAVSSWDGEHGGFTAHPDNYDRLINATLRLPEVTFVTLNYDIIFDRRLAIDGPLDSIGAYLAPGKNWALIKPHGSIDWGRRVLNAPRDLAPTDPLLAQTFATIGEPVSLGDEIFLRRHATVSELRGLVRGGGMPVTNQGLELYYPALAVPLGEQDELVCPPEHIEYVKEITGHWDPLDVLVIGYSGLDQGVLELLSWGGRALKSLTVVSNTPENAELTAERITAHVRVARNQPEPVELYDDGFSNFVHGGHLDQYVDRVIALGARH